MSFTGLTWWGVLSLLGAVVVLLGLLHLLRVRPRQVRVITTLFWAHAVEKTRARTLLERLRHLFTYLLLFSICALIVVGLGRPQWSRSGAAALEVIVLDAGANMTARNAGGATHLDLARQAVVDEVGQLAGSQKAAVVVMDPLPRLVHGFEDSPALIGRELEQIKPANTAASGDLGRDDARSLLGDSGGQVVLVTNRSIPSSDLAVRVIRVGEPCSNAAIISALFIPDESNPLRGRLVTRVACYGSKDGPVGLRIVRAGGAMLLDERARIAPGATHDFVLNDMAADGDRLSLRLTESEGAPVDDELSLRVPSRNRIRVAVSADLPALLRLGLESDPAVSLVGPTEAHDVAVRRGGANMSVERPTLIVDSADLPILEGQPVAVFANNALTRGLLFEGGESIATDAHSGRLIEIAGQMLSAYEAAKPPRFILSEKIWSETVALYRQPAFAVLLARGVRQLAGWDVDPVVLTPDRHLQDPLWPKRAMLAGEVVVMPADRESADLSAAKEQGDRSRGDNGSWIRLEPFELLILMAAALFLVEAYLQTRGRIA